MNKSLFTEVSGGTPEICVHCGTCSSLPVYWQGMVFCCSGCQAVYNIINEQGLQKYYLLRERVGGGSSPVLASDKWHDYSYADQSDFLSQYAYGANKQTFDIYVEGVHCAACLWLIEKLPQYIANIHSARLHMGDNTLTLVLKEGGCSQALQQLQKWGYRPHPIRSGADAEIWRKKNYQKDLSRLAVAAFSAGNIMLISVCLYSGVTGGLARYFEWTSLVVILPSLLYSAVPLYKSSWNSIKQKRISIDFPIVVAIFTALFVSVVGLFDYGPTYFDSISSLIFLILASRMFLKTLQNHHIEVSRFQSFLDIFQVRKWDGSQFSETSPNLINVGDRVRVLAGETVPVDGEIISGEGFLNTAMINGESAPLEVSLHQPVLMGATLVTGWIEIKAKVRFHESRIQKLLRDLQGAQKKMETLRIADRVGQWFLFVVMMIAFAVIVRWWSVDPAIGLHRALSFIIVACPCTFASVLPLVFSLALRQAARFGILIKEASVFEKIKKIRNVFFDKTGVLTEGVFKVQKVHWIKNLSSEDLASIYSLVCQSEHPVSRSLAEWLQRQQPILIHQLVSTQSLNGQGLIGVDSRGQSIKLLKAQSVSTISSMIPNYIDIWIDDLRVGEVILGDCLRKEARSVIQQTQSRGFDCHIISGDRAQTVHQVADMVGVVQSNAHGDLSFEDKAVKLSALEGTLMIGDGNNDSLALQKSDIAIAFHGGVETALQSSDIYFSQCDLSRLPIFIDIALKTNKLIKISLITSVFYNLVAGTFALMGFIHPLLAAVIMPINAITVFLICQWVFRERKYVWK